MNPSLAKLTEEMEALRSNIEEIESSLHSTPMRYREDRTIGSLSTVKSAKDSGIASASGIGMRLRMPREDREDVTPKLRFREDASGNSADAQRSKTMSGSKPREYDIKGGFMKPATYDGGTPWIDFKAHFESVALINRWSDIQRGLYLAACLRGAAQGVLGNLQGGEKHEYKKLVEALESRFSPVNQTELYRATLRDRRLKPSETLPELGESIRRLAHLAYPSAPRDVTETLARDYFVDALPDFDMRLRIQQSRPQYLNDAIRLAVEIEAFTRADKQRRGERGYARPALVTERDGTDCQPVDNFMQTFVDRVNQSLMEIKGEIRSLQKDATKAKAQETRQKSRPKCYNCGEIGHMQRDCRSTGGRGMRRFSGRKPQQNGKTNVEARQPLVRVGTKKEAGLYIEAVVNGVPMTMLIDTGATVTLISTTTYGRICDKPELRNVRQEILAAQGTPLEIIGIANFKIEIGDMKFTNDALVSKLGVDGILGLDFLQSHHGIVNVAEKILTLNGTEFSLFIRGKLGCYRVSVSEKINIPPHTEVICNGRVDLDLNKEIGGCDAIVEPDLKFADRGIAMVARTLVTFSDNVPIRLMNITDEVKQIHKDTIVGNLYPVERIENTDLLVNHETKSKLPEAVQKLYEQTITNLDPDQSQKVYSLLGKYSHIFAKDDNDMGRTSVFKHKIETGNAAPIKQPPRRFPPKLADTVDKEVDAMIERGIVQPSRSPWSSGVVLVKKKDGTLRFCVDYRRLNQVTTKDAYPLPRVDDSIDTLAGAKWFCTIDLFAGYWQVEMEDKDRQKTAFSTRKGLYEFTVMPFGLCNSGATFERLMETVLSGLHWDICLVYIDDVIVMGKTFEETLRNLETVFGRLSDAGLKLKARKCELFKKKVLFLGYVITGEGIKTDDEKIKVVKQWPTPVNVTEVRSFIGLCSYYRKFIPRFAVVARPLHRLTEKGREFKWTQECDEAFSELKVRLTTAPILIHPDMNSAFTLDTDASGEGIGGILSQVRDGKERVVAYASRALSKAERKYCVTRKELLAVVTFVKYFRHYLFGQKFTIRTDHSALRWLYNFKEPEGQVARWIEVLGCYNFEIQHRPGVRHRNADALSRIPKQNQGVCDGDKIQSVNIVLPGHQNQSGPGCQNIQIIQDSDDDVKHVKQWVCDGVKPSYQSVKSKSHVVKALYNHFETLFVEKNILYRRWNDGIRMIRQAIIPWSERRSVLQMCHDAKASCHLGVKKTLTKVRQHFYWPGLQRDVRQYVLGCEFCMKRKKSRKAKRAPMQIERSTLPMERIALDIMGPLPETTKGNKYILVVQDYFTKWIEIFAMENMEAVTVATFLINEVVARFGVPGTIHSDQGRQFEGAVFKELCKMLDIHKTRTTAFHPKSDGMVERSNQTVMNMVSAYVSEHQDNWDDYLAFVGMAYRSSEHETTKFTPNMLMLGREVGTPLHIQYALPRAEKPMPSSLWAWEVRDELEKAHRIAREYSEGEMLRQKKYHDRRLSWQSFEPGDQVLVYFPQKKTGKSPKLMSFWQGPFVVVARKSSVTYEVRRESERKTQVVHVDRLKEHRTQTLVGKKSQDCPISINNESGAQPVEEPLHEDRTEKAEREDGLNGDSLESLPAPYALDSNLISSRTRVRKMPARFADYVF